MLRLSGYFEALRQLFPERQLYYRRQGKVSFIHFSTRAQYFLSAVALAIFGWIAFSSGHYFLNEITVLAGDYRIARLDEANRNLIHKNQITEDRFLKLTRELEEKHKQLLSVLEQRNLFETQVSSLTKDVVNLSRGQKAVKEDGERTKNVISDLQDKLSTALVEKRAAQSSLDSAAKRVDALESQSAKDKDKHSQLDSEISKLRTQLTKVTKNAVSLEQQLAAATESKTSAERSQSAANEHVRFLRQRLATLETEIGESHRQANQLRQQVATLESQTSAPSRHAAARQNPQTENADTASADDTGPDKGNTSAKQTADAGDSDRVAILESRLAAIRAAQQNLLDRIRMRTKSNIQRLEDAISMTGVDLENMLGDTRKTPNGQGGPLLSATTGNAAKASIEQGKGFDDSLTRLENHLIRWGGLQRLISSMPLSRPVDMGYVSSTFGVRRDPITKRPANHFGIDYAGFRNLPILSTAQGRVTFAGRNGAFGLMVEIDHGFGLKTRYGHLRKILVTRGQTISYRQKIGLMGNTGRSTGPHVHYEILYRGQPQDPAKFIEAGEHVLKG